MIDPIFVSEKDKVYAMLGTEVLASGDSLQEVEEKISHLQVQADHNEFTDRIASATHVETPNGIKGKIVGRNQGIWGDAVTIRLANGRVVSLEVNSSLQFSKEDPYLGSPLDKMARTLEQSCNEDIESLEKRYAQIGELHKQARNLILQGASHEDLKKLDGYAVQALLEKERVASLIESIKVADAPDSIEREWNVYEQASKGGDWLDDVVNDMAAEVDQTNLDQFMDEGPEAFAAGLDDGMLNDPVGVRELAFDHVQSKVAFVEQPFKDQYVNVWMERLDECRQKAAFLHAARPQEKTASYKDDGIDEGLFL